MTLILKKKKYWSWCLFYCMHQMCIEVIYSRLCGTLLEKNLFMYHHNFIMWNTSGIPNLSLLSKYCNETKIRSFWVVCVASKEHCTICQRKLISSEIYCKWICSTVMEIHDDILGNTVLSSFISFTVSC